MQKSDNNCEDMIVQMGSKLETRQTYAMFGVYLGEHARVWEYSEMKRWGRCGRSGASIDKAFLFIIIIYSFSLITKY